MKGEELNKRIWYRLAKVIFIITFIISQVFGLIVAFYVTAETQKYYTCKNESTIIHEGALSVFVHQKIIDELVAACFKLQPSKSSYTLEEMYAMVIGKEGFVYLDEQLVTYLQEHKSDRFNIIQKIFIQAGTAIGILLIFGFLSRIIRYILTGDRVL